MNKRLFNGIKILLILLIMALMFSACSGTPSIDGNWQEPSSGLSMHIDKNETVTIGLNGASFSMGYSLEDPNVLIINGTKDGSIPKIKMTYTLEEDKLTLTLDGVNSVFYRVKDK